MFCRAEGEIEVRSLCRWLWLRCVYYKIELGLLFGQFDALQFNAVRVRIRRGAIVSTVD